MKRLICFILIIVTALSFSGCVFDNFFTEDIQKITYDGKLHVYYLDVGQADSIFILLPNSKNMLIDAGTKESGEDIVNVLSTFGINHIDYLVATHPHADHIGGMEYVVESFGIGEIFMPDVYNDTNRFKKLLKAVKNKDYTVTTAFAGVDIFNDNDLQATFVAPNSYEYEEINDYSAVIKLTYGDTRFVFAGDAQKESEDEIRSNIKCDVLKVGHHGSNSSTSKNFLKKTEPEYAVITCGSDNDYDHPHKKVLKRLEEAGVTVYRTDLNGTIAAISDGKSIEFITER